MSVKRVMQSYAMLDDAEPIRALVGEAELDGLLERAGGTSPPDQVGPTDEADEPPVAGHRDDGITLIIVDLLGMGSSSTS